MRHVNLDQLERITKRRCIDALEAAEKELRELATEEERKAYIKKNYKKWTKLSPFLWVLGYCKCWYSEVPLKFGEGQVEHFRPKNEVWKSDHTGYWWLAFCVSNFRYAHSTVNTRRTDYCTDKKVGKGCYFPLANGDDDRATSDKEMNKENGKIILLDPTVASDCRLIRFLDSGRPEPEFDEDEDSWRHKRAKLSIDYYHLDDGTWNGQRKEVMKAVGKLCDDLLDLDSATESEKEEELIEEIMNRIHPFSKFSSAAFQVVRSKGFFEQVKGVGV